MGSDQALSFLAWQTPPGGFPVALPLLPGGPRGPGFLSDFLRRELGVEQVAFYRSGREALRVAMRCLAERSGRDEAVIPAYTCWSVPAAAVAAGLRVRLVDVDERGRIEPSALAALPLDRAACLVVCNLFGIAEPVAPLSEKLADADVAVIDDAAQAFGAATRDGRAGSRGSFGALSFGRGKPLQGLGGGALVWSDPELQLPDSPAEAWNQPAAVLRALAWNTARLPLVFARLSRIPSLGIGETTFDPGFPRGPISGAALALCTNEARRFPAELERCRGANESLLRVLGEQTLFRPVEAELADTPARTRLSLIAPDPVARGAALAALRMLGASQLYPASLDEVEALSPHLASPARCPTARHLADCLLTLPADLSWSQSEQEFVVETLARIAPK